MPVSTRMPFEAYETRWARYVEQGGPAEHEYDGLTELLRDLHGGLEREVITREQTRSLIHAIGDDGLAATMQGWAYRKPHGYAGDFEMIDRIYRHHVTPLEAYRNWDLYFHAQAAPQAVRNRKAYFVHLLATRSSAAPRAPLRVLNVGCGPCHDVRQAIEEVGDTVAFTCLDIDPHAIAYAQRLLGPSPSVEFHEGNVLRFRPERRFDLVWSAGLLDYFNDRTFVTFLRRAAKWVRPGGEIVVGNFSDANPTRAYMEVVGEWFLHHRSVRRLEDLATAAGFEASSVAVEHEAERVNLFLHVRVPD